MHTMRAPARPYTAFIIVTLVFPAPLLLGAGPAPEESPAPPAGEGSTPPAEKSWLPGFRWDLYTAAEVTYDSNTFRLRSRQRSRLEDDRPSDRASGRFDDMDSVDDVVLSGRLWLDAKTKGLAGRRLLFGPRFDFDYYVENTRKTYPTFGFGAEQELDSRSALKLDFDYRLGVFSKNFLTDATDRLDSVTTDERRYDNGVYDATKLKLAYEVTLWKAESKKKWKKRLKKRRKAGLPVTSEKRPFLRSLRGTGQVAYFNRRYDSPLGNFDRDGVEAGAGLRADFAKGLRLEAGYIFRYFESPGGKEVLIRDEDDFLEDLNGDGDALDQNIRTRQNVDRSRMDHRFRVGVRYEILEDLYLGGSYQITLQEFASDERFDTSHKDREDLQHRARIGLRWDITGDVSVRLEGVYVHEGTNKDGVPPGEDDAVSYDRFLVSFGLQAKLF